MDHSLLLLEPNEILRKGLSCQLAETRRIRITEAADAARGIAAAQREPFALAIIGPGIAVAERYGVVDRIRGISPATACIVIVRGDRRLELEGAVQSQASGILCSRSPCQELPSAIESVLSGRRYFSRSLQQGLLRVAAATKARSAGELTTRERAILCRISRGADRCEIAAELGLSQRTVEAHRLNMMRKLGVHKTAQLVRFAVREGLVEA